MLSKMSSSFFCVAEQQHSFNLSCAWVIFTYRCISLSHSEAEDTWVGAVSCYCELGRNKHGNGGVSMVGWFRSLWLVSHKWARYTIWVHWQSIRHKEHKGGEECILAHGPRNPSSQLSSFIAFALSLALGTKPWTNGFWRAVSYPKSFQSLLRVFLLAFYDRQLSKPASSALPSSPYKATNVIKGPTSMTLFYPSHLPKAPPPTLLT